MSVRHIRTGAVLRGLAVHAPGVSIRETHRPVAPPPVSAEPAPPEPVHDTRELQALSTTLTRVIEAVADFEQRRQQSFQEFQQLAVEVGFAAAERLLREALDRGSFSIEEVIRETVERATPAMVLSVALHPTDLQRLQDAREAHPPPAEIASLQLVGDPKVTQGSCRIACEGFDIASILEDEIEELKLHVMQGLENAQIERRQPETADRGVQRYPDRRGTA